MHLSSLWVIQWVHEACSSGHLGIQRTTAHIQNALWWPPYFKNSRPVTTVTIQILLTAAYRTVRTFPSAAMTLVSPLHPCAEYIQKSLTQFSSGLSHFQCVMRYYSCFHGQGNPPMSQQSKTGCVGAKCYRKAPLWASRGQSVSINP